MSRSKEPTKGQCVYFPVDLHLQVDQSSKANQRSFSGEVIHALRAAFPEKPDTNFEPYHDKKNLKKRKSS